MNFTSSHSETYPEIHSFKKDGGENHTFHNSKLCGCMDECPLGCFFNYCIRSLFIPRLEKCIIDIKQWSADNDLKLNELNLQY